MDAATEILAELCRRLPNAELCRYGRTRNMWLHHLKDCNLEIAWEVVRLPGIEQMTPASFMAECVRREALKVHVPASLASALDSIIRAPREAAQGKQLALKV
jgi:hypothetical protein